MCRKPLIHRASLIVQPWLCPTGWKHDKVGLLAGSGRFPILFAEKARSVGLPVVCVGIRHEAAPELAAPGRSVSTGPASPSSAG